MKTKQSQNPFKPDQVVTATKTFAYAGGVIHRGDRYRGSDQAVEENWSIFLAGELLPHELPPREEPPVFDHQPHVQVLPSIPPHRQVKSTVNAYFDGGFAPGSPGARSGRPSGFGSAITIGRIDDALDPRVRNHPEWFSWVERIVRPEDLDRLERAEQADQAKG